MENQNGIRLSKESVKLINDALSYNKGCGFSTLNFTTLLSVVAGYCEELSEYIYSHNSDETKRLDYTVLTTSLAFFTNEYQEELLERMPKEDNNAQEDAESYEDDLTEPEPDRVFVIKLDDPIPVTFKVEMKGNSEQIEDSDEVGTASNPFPIDLDYKKDLIFIDVENQKEIKVPANEDVVKVYDKLKELSVVYSIKELEPIHFAVALFAVDHQVLKDLFKGLGLSYSEAQKAFSAETIDKINFIPFDMTNFLDMVNLKVNTNYPCEILKREEEIEKLWNIMLKKNKRNAVIVGEAGVGKTALIEKITYEIENGTCPEEFLGFKVISLDVNSLIAGTKYRGMAEMRISDLIDFLSNHDDVILFIDEVHTILGAGSCYEGEMDLANALKPILARGDTIVIGATTLEEYNKYFKNDAALCRRFEMIEVREPLSRDVLPMIQNKIKVLSEFHGVRISNKMAEYAVMIANCFNFEKKNPDKTLDLIDRSMVAAKKAKRKWVSQESILKNFDIYFKMWDKMSEESKKLIAYHEAGHYVVGKASEKLIDRNWIAISIMPTKDYMGVTVSEIDNEVVPICDKNYYIEEIGFTLGGRAGEKIIRFLPTSGAESDLKKASQIAYDVVTKYGLYPKYFGGDRDIPENLYYFNDEKYNIFSEKTTNVVTDAITELISRAYSLAENILDEHRNVLNAIANALLENKIMSEAELDKIWKENMN